ncbi:MAG: S9 family peptidase [Tenericutes bacterium HGW-Tenericutes-6]|nr:MAG: S9 family peptidase [Tenericutes bacterium HGW-Tenericutes-6]
MNQIELNDFLSFKYISNLTESPNQTAMAFTVGKANEKGNEYTYDLYYSDGKKHQKIQSLKNKASFIFEDEQNVLFQYAKTKKEEKQFKEEKYTLYYRMNLITRKIELAYQFPMPVTIIHILENDKLLLSAQLTVDEHALYRSDEEKRKAFLKEAKKEQLYEDIEEIPFYFNGQGFIANKRQQLFLYDKVSKSYVPLVDSDFSVGQVRVSKDKEHIFYSGQQMTGVRSMTTHVFCYHVKDKSTDILYHENDFSMNQMYLLGHKLIVAGKDMKDFGINQNPNFYELKNKKLELLNIYGGTIGNTVGADVRLGTSKSDFSTDEHIYFLSTVDDHVELCTMDHLGTIKTVFQMNGSIDGMVQLKDQIFAVGLYRQKLQEIYMLDIENQKVVQRTTFNQKVLKNKYVASPKTFYVRQNSHIVKGFLLYPKDFDEKKTYPAILNIHGGPKTVYGKVYYHEMQYWANQGYFVMFANPRGSDGKGDVFADIRGKYGTIDYDDLMPFVELVTHKVPHIDQKRLFVTGGSYGGFMTNWMVGHTDIFKAAATQRSISNWLSFHGTSDIGFYFSKDQTAGHPLVDTDKLWLHSPIKYVKHMKTPLLIIHSDQDYRCPIEQAMQLFSLLKEQGTPTKMVWFKGENHELSRSGKPQARIKRLTEITEWFNRYR